MALFKKLMVGLSSDSSILLVKNIELKLGSQVFLEAYACPLSSLKVRIYLGLVLPLN